MTPRAIVLLSSIVAVSLLTPSAFAMRLKYSGVGRAGISRIPIIVVSELPHALLSFTYDLPSHVQIPQPWTLKHPETLQIPIPDDAVAAYVAWDQTLLGNKIEDPAVTSTQNHIVLKMSWWGDGFPISVAFKPLARK